MRLGLHITCPVVPWPQIHQRFSVKGGDVEIIGVAIAQFSHGRGISHIQGGPIGLLRPGITIGQRIDVGLFFIRGIFTPPGLSKDNLD